MAIAKLTIDLEAQVARLEQDLSRANGVIESFGRDAQTSLGRIKDVFAGSFISDKLQQGLQELAAVFPALINGVAKFQDLAEETGASAAALASFQTAADVSGVSVETLAGLMTRLTGKLSALKDEDKGAAQAIKNLGINFEEFSKMRPDEKIKALAEAFGRFADGEAKTSNALALFGKSGAAVLKFFKEYQESGESSIRLTDEQIQRADAFADAQARASSQLRQHAQVMAVEALPAITAFKDALSEALKAMLSVDSAGGGMASVNAVQEWAFAGAKGVAVLVEALIGLAKLARAVAGSFQAVGADISLAFTVPAAAVDPRGGSVSQRLLAIRGLLDERNKTVADANQRYIDLWNYDGDRMSKAIEKASQAARLGLTGVRANAFSDPRSTLFGTAAKPQLNPVRAVIGGSGKKDKPDIFGPDIPEAVADALKRIEGADENKLARLRDTLTQLANIRAAGGNVPDSAFSRITDEITKLDPAARAATEAMKELQDVMREGVALTQANLTPLERYTQEIERINTLLQKGAISDTTAQRAAQKALDDMNGKTAKTKSLAEELGMTFSSAFEDAIVGGKGLSGVLKGLEQDILRIITRKMITEPLGNWITGAIGGSGGGDIFGKMGGWLSSLFAGGFATGGYIPPGKWGMTGERGPEPIYGGRSGVTVHPASTGSVVINLSVQGPVSAATQQQLAAAAARGLQLAQMRGT